MDKSNSDIGTVYSQITFKHTVDEWINAIVSITKQRRLEIFFIIFELFKCFERVWDF